MKKIVLLSFLSVMSLVLVGCGSSKDADTTVNTTDTTVVANADVEGQKFTEKSCNDYIKVMECVLENSPEGIKEQTQKNFDSTITLRESLNATQLKDSCTVSMDGMTKQKDVVESMGCSL